MDYKLKKGIIAVVQYVYGLDETPTVLVFNFETHKIEPHYFGEFLYERLEFDIDLRELSLIKNSSNIEKSNEYILNL